MKTVSKHRAFMLAVLFALCLACLAAGMGMRYAVRAAGTAVETEVKSVEVNTDASGMTWFTLSVNDYEGQSNYNGGDGRDAVVERLNALNTLSHIYFDGTSLSELTDGSFAGVDMYINLWGRNGAFSVNKIAQTSIEVKAGCEFPSFAYASGAGDTVYVTEKDVVFQNTDGHWDVQRPVETMPALTVADWKTTWSDDTTQIMIMPGLGNLDAGGYVNDNAGTYPVDLAQYIVIGDAMTENGVTENGRTVREIVAQNQSENTYSGVKFPMTVGGVYSPVLIYGGGDHIEVYILDEYKAQGNFTLTIKKGFTLTIGGVNYVTAEDLVYGYVTAFDGSAMVNAWTRFYEITWNVNGTETKQFVADGTVPSFGGSTDKASTESTDFTFAGWDTEPVEAEANATYTATYTESARKYNVTFMNGSEQFEQVSAAYGTIPAPAGTPEKASDVQYDYTFSGWSATDGGEKLDELPAVSGEATYYAVFTQSVRKYTVTYKNGEDVLASYQAEYGAVTPAYEGETPVKAADAQYTYTFKDWGTVAATVKSDAVYEAQYTQTVNKYTVVFMNGTEKLAETEYEYGAVPAYDGAAPEKAADVQYTYTFGGWSEEEGGALLDQLPAVTGAATYYAAFRQTVNKYVITVTFEGVEKAPAELTLEYGSALDFAQFSQDGYEFAVYDGESEVDSYTVTGDGALTVKYTKAPDGGEDQKPGGDDQTPGGDDQTPSDGEPTGCSGALAASGIAGAAAAALLLGAGLILRRRKQD